MKGLMQRAARSVGLDVLSLAYSKEFIYDHHLRELLARHKITTVLDIGANIGGYGALLRRLGYAGTIHSFEPVTAPHQQLAERALGDAKWHVHKHAFGSEVGTATINVMAGTELCSFLDPIGSSQKMTKVGTEEVMIKTLDSYNQIDWSRTFVKIDTQGHDLAVMRGGAKVLAQVPLIQTEVSFLPIYEGMPTFGDTFAHLRSIGFDVTGLFPVSRDDDMRVREFDCVAVNRRNSHG